MSENPSNYDHGYDNVSFNTILQILCAKCDENGDTECGDLLGMESAAWRDLIATVKKQGWYVNKKERFVLCPSCREEEGL